jgi:hypothetical protein
VTVQRVAQIFGWVFVLVAVWGFVVSGASMEAGEDAPAILGLFPVNVLHNLAHLLLGIWGILAARTFDGAKRVEVAVVLQVISGERPTLAARSRHSSAFSSSPATECTQARL